MKNIKRILCILLALLSLVLAFPVTAFAAEPLEINLSSVEDDFKAWNIDKTQFPKNADDKNVYLMHMLEYGYDEKGNMINYCIYLYFYNPSGIAIQNSDLNKVQMSVLDANGELLRYRKYGLTLISSSVSNGFEHVFYKFKVENALTFANIVNKSKRQYKISGAEILRKGDDSSGGGAPEYRLDSHYIWTGYQSFYNKDRKAISTLYYERKDMDVISLDLFPATWMSASSDKGKDYKYEVFSVYFAVDNYFIKKYGNPVDETSGLRRIRGEYNEYTVNGFWTGSTEFYNIFNGLKNKNLYDYMDIIDDSGYASNFSKYGFLSSSYDVEDISTVFHGAEHGRIYDITYNVPAGDNEYHRSNYSIANDYAKSLNRIMNLNMVFNSDKSYMSAIDFKNQWISLGKPYHKNYGLKEYDITTSDGCLNDSIKSYYSSLPSNIDPVSKLIQKLFNGDLFVDKEGYPDILPIVQVDKGDVLYMNDEALGNKYFMNNESVQEFKAFVKDNELKDNTVYVMRFAVRDYVSSEVDIYDNVAEEEIDNPLTSNDDSFAFVRTVFDGFDVMETEWEDTEGKRSVLPVAATPITVTGGIISPSVSNPNDPSDGEEPSWLQKLWEWFNNFATPLKVIIGLAAVCVLLLILRLIWSGVGWIITGIGRGIGAIFGFTEKRVDKHRERAERKEDREFKRADEARKVSNEQRERERQDWDRAEREERYNQTKRENKWKAEDREWLEESRAKRKKITKKDDK